MKKDISYGAVVIDKDNRFLLVHHASGNHWDHPKGHPEKNESPVKCAEREIAEEAGISVNFINGFVEKTGWILPDGRPKEVTYFLAVKTGSSAESGPPGEILGTIWLPYSEALKKITYKQGREILNKAAAFLEII